MIEKKGRKVWRDEKEKARDREKKERDRRFVKNSQKIRKSKSLQWLIPRPIHELKLKSTSFAEKNFADEITWIT